MRSRTIAILLLVLELFGAGCGAYMYSLQSSFFSKFSLKELVDRNESSAGVSSKNPDATSFDLEYSLNEVTGTIKISTKKGPMRFYTLEADLREKSK
jgi:hypothetical protein